ncbi:MAG: hypothetical protein JWR21_2610 [Herminiimonas sp.]|nr:hypothetical protein [Herminiimonas sp.]
MKTVPLGPSYVEVDLDDIVNRLLRLVIDDPMLAQATDRDHDLPVDAVPYLLEKLDHAFAICGVGDEQTAAAAYRDLAHWIDRSARFYRARSSVELLTQDLVPHSLH